MGDDHMKSPKGWTLDKYCRPKPYMVQLTIKGKKAYVGHFATEEEAHAAYLKVRAENPPSRRSGGRKQCGICKEEYTISKLKIHVRSCAKKNLVFYDRW